MGAAASPEPRRAHCRRACGRAAICSGPDRHPAAAPPPPNGGSFALTLDDGPDPEVTPRVLDVLDQHRTRATFFASPQRAQAHPALLREIVARGHDVQNHSHWHRHRLRTAGPRALAREVEHAQQVLADLCGVRATLLSARPRGCAIRSSTRCCTDQACNLVSWTRRGFDTVSRDAERVLGRLTRGMACAATSCCCTTATAQRSRRGQPVVLEVLPRLLSPRGRARPARAPPCATRCRLAAADAALSRSGRWSPQDLGFTTAPMVAPQADLVPARVADLRRGASARHRRCGPFSWHFARGKLGAIRCFARCWPAAADRTEARACSTSAAARRLLASLLARVQTLAAARPLALSRVRRPSGVRYTGIELMPTDVARAEQALAHLASAAAA